MEKGQGMKIGWHTTLGMVFNGYRIGSDGVSAKEGANM